MLRYWKQKHAGFTWFMVIMSSVMPYQYKSNISNQIKSILLQTEPYSRCSASGETWSFCHQEDLPPIVKVISPPNTEVIFIYKVYFPEHFSSIYPTIKSIAVWFYTLNCNHLITSRLVDDHLISIGHGRKFSLIMQCNNMLMVFYLNRKEYKKYNCIYCIHKTRGFKKMISDCDQSFHFILLMCLCELSHTRSLEPLESRFKNMLEV